MTTVDKTPLEDTGTRSTYETGACRDARTGKGRFDLISPIAWMRLAVHVENGIDKYGLRNWELGIPLHTYVDSAFRHLTRWVRDKLLGRESTEDHLAAVMWNIMCLIHTEYMIESHRLPAELDDIALIEPAHHKKEQS